jgi:fused signal recognition particle receptor
MDPATGASLPLIGGEIALIFGFALLLGLWLDLQAPPAPQARPTPEADAVRPGARQPDLEDDPTTESHGAVRPTPLVAAPQEPQPSVFGFFRDALTRSRDVLRTGLDRLLGRPLDAAATEELEEALLRSDVGVGTTNRLLEAVRNLPADSDLRGALAAEMKSILRANHAPFAIPAAPRPYVVLVVGVNGSGKTTTIGKLAARLRGEGHKVLLAAGDTFRAAAEQQLGIWAERAGVDLLSLEEGADPGAVAFRAMELARRDGHDVVLFDTAGRLQSKKPLMDELGKVRRVLDKGMPGAPHETLLVLDGTMGQNGMSQAQLFHSATPLSGVVVTKLDGTAKGGMILAIAAELSLPVKLVGLGEKVGDLRDFDPEVFVDALL